MVICPYRTFVFESSLKKKEATSQKLIVKIHKTIDFIMSLMLSYLFYLSCSKQLSSITKSELTKTIDTISFILLVLLFRTPLFSKGHFWKKKLLKSRFFIIASYLANYRSRLYTLFF